MSESVNILVVDDNEGIRESLSDILRIKGHSVIAAKNGLEALVKVREKNFDIILMDFLMPELDGIKAYEEIKKISPDTIVVLMTAYLGDIRVEEVVQEGIAKVVEKPFYPIEEIDELLEEKKRIEEISILIVDDTISSCQALELSLQARGYDVYTANSGEQALAAIRERLFDIVFVDVDMSPMNGLETFLAIRKINASIAVIMMTGYFGIPEIDNLAREALNRNAYAYLHKPFDIKSVASIVEEVCRRRRLARST